MSKISGRRVSGAFFMGVFVILSMLILFGSIFWLGLNKFFKDKEYFVTYFTGSVEGLETGSSVKYLGVPVGTVSDIKLAPDGKLVEVIYQIDKKIEMNDSLRVKIEFAGIAGGKFLQLHYPFEKDFYAMHPKLKGFIPKYQVIPSAPSGFDEIEIAAKDLMNNLMQFKAGDISTSATNFLDEYTKFIQTKELKEIIENTALTTAHFANIAAKADSSSIINNLTLTSVKLLETTDRLKLFTELLNNKIKEIEIQSRIDAAISKYDSLIFDIRSVVKNVGFQSGTVMLTLNETLEQFKSTNRELRKSLRAISDNPSQIFLSNPPEKEK